MSTAAHPQTAAERPALSLVKDTPETHAEVVDAPIEGTVIDRPSAPVRPAWIESQTARLTRARRHALGNRLYIPQAGRGYLNLLRRWADSWTDDYPQMIRTARTALKAAGGDVTEEAKLKATVEARRADYRRHRLIHAGRSAAGAIAVGAPVTVGIATGGLWIDMALAAAGFAAGAWHGRPGATRGAIGAAPASITAEPTVDLDDDTIQKAVSECGFRGAIRIVQPTQTSPDGSSVTVFDMPGASTAAELKKKLASLAAALGRDVSMVDVTKAGAEGRVSLWMSNTPPFDAPRPSPLLDLVGALDAFKVGVPVAWDKRGKPIVLPINNSSFVIAGMTRSGKGVGASNLVVGAAMDPRINLRIVAGKENGEWDAYAKAGVAATYFKPSPERLLALANALIADMGRRNRDLGKLGKSKVTVDTIDKLGGIELLIVDEVATYTRPGKPLRDEILEAFIQLSAVAAGAGILMVLITQYPEADVLPAALAMNCGSRWAMRVDTAAQSNAILGGGASGMGRDASKFDPPIPGLGWLVNPFAGITDLARSFDLDEDERGEITELMVRAAALRDKAGRLAGQWGDPIEHILVAETGLSSLAGGPHRTGYPGRAIHELTPEQRMQMDALRGCLTAMDHFGRDEAQVDEMADFIGSSMLPSNLGHMLRTAGAGGTVKVTVPHKEGRVNGYRRADIADAVEFIQGV
ncbi:FtsK/SpoIIIE domain-containing protein [Streptomyces sp. NPDC096310]|uniref:FtsK/SpoIIIE domain-containing protein n=1 Tax=Streptomyces sp. NPDC096310 TaxID=3366082 RepID=UPI003821A53C